MDDATIIVEVSAAPLKTGFVCKLGAAVCWSSYVDRDVKDLR